MAWEEDLVLLEQELLKKSEKAIKCPSLHCANMRFATKDNHGEYFKCEVCERNIWISAEKSTTI